ncbi:MAG: tetrahydrofolate dehydrogenase/cyclohydrolase catalytic domain-containing protein, partial [Eubacteriales bacterium]|nr:tetrahydrofolate dehydrogenase/cyclohydrolase catalytic domain-containing protein [Eubacteriales bacterium]
MANVLLGKDVADQMSEELIERAARLRENGVEPTLAIVRVGEEGDDLAYERGALKRAEKVGVKVCVRTLPLDVSQEAILQEIEGINADPAI